MTRSAAIVVGVHVLSSPASASDLADAIFSDFQSNMEDLVDNQVTMGPVHVSWNDGSGIFSGDGTASGAGTLSDTTLPPNCAVLFRKTTAPPGGPGRGRMSLPWAATEASVDEAGNIDPAAVTVMTAAAESWRVDAAASDNQLVVLHAGAGTPAAITAFTAQPLLATQRRRMR